jgi:hypothetical protein
MEANEPLLVELPPPRTMPPVAADRKGCGARDEHTRERGLWVAAAGAGGPELSDCIHIKVNTSARKGRGHPRERPVQDRPAGRTPTGELLRGDLHGLGLARGQEGSRADGNACAWIGRTAGQSGVDLQCCCLTADRPCAQVHCNSDRASQYQISARASSGAAPQLHLPQLPRNSKPLSPVATRPSRLRRVCCCWARTTTALRAVAARVEVCETAAGVGVGQER